MMVEVKTQVQNLNAAPAVTTTTSRAKMFIRAFNRTAAIVAISASLAFAGCATTNSTHRQALENPAAQEQTVVADATPTQQPKAQNNPVDQLVGEIQQTNGKIDGALKKYNKAKQEEAIHKKKQEEAKQKSEEAKQKSEEAKQKAREGCLSAKADLDELDKSCKEGKDGYCDAYAEGLKLFKKTCGDILTRR